MDSKVCLACLRTEKDENFVSIFVENEKLSELVFELTGLKLQNLKDTPTHLCSSCISDLEKSVSFRNSIIRNHRKYTEFNSQSKLRNLLCGIKVVDNFDSNGLEFDGSRLVENFKEDGSGGDSLPMVQIQNYIRNMFGANSGNEQHENQVHKSEFNRTYSPEPENQVYRFKSNKTYSPEPENQVYRFKSSRTYSPEPENQVHRFKSNRTYSSEPENLPLNLLSHSNLENLQSKKQNSGPSDETQPYAPKLAISSPKIVRNDQEPETDENDPRTSPASPPATEILRLLLKSGHPSDPESDNNLKISRVEGSFIKSEPVEKNAVEIREIEENGGFSNASEESDRNSESPKIHFDFPFLLSALSSSRADVTSCQDCKKNECKKCLKIDTNVAQSWNERQQVAITKIIENQKNFHKLKRLDLGRKIAGKV